MTLLKTKNFEVAANLSGAETAPRVAILMPGRLDTKDYINFTSHAQLLSSRDFLVAAIDVPGTWDSPGNLNSYTTSLYVQVINELIEYFGNRPTVLLGHSRGGATAMLASGNEAVTGLVLINAAYESPTPPRPGAMVNGKLREHRDMPPGNVRTKEQRTYDLPMIYFEDGAKHNPLKALRQFRGAKLLVHATRDEFKDLAVVRDIYDSLAEPKMFLEIDSTHDYRLFPEVIEEVNKALLEFVDTQEQ